MPQSIEMTRQLLYDLSLPIKPSGRICDEGRQERDDCASKNFGAGCVAHFQRGARIANRSCIVASSSVKSRIRQQYSSDRA
jgi:hypothetical protein